MGKVYVIGNANEVLLVRYNEVGNNTVLSLKAEEAEDVVRKVSNIIRRKKE